jgi:hypothetical protein
MKWLPISAEGVVALDSLIDKELVAVMGNLIADRANEDVDILLRGEPPDLSRPAVIAYRQITLDIKTFYDK